MNNKKTPEAWNTRKDALIDFNELSEFYDQDTANEKALFDDRLPLNFKRTGTLGRGRSVFEQDDSDDDDDDEEDITSVQPGTAEFENVLQEQLRKAVGPGYSNELIHHHFGTNTYQSQSQPVINETEFRQDVASLSERVTHNLQFINESEVNNAESNHYSSDDRPYRNRRMTTDSEYSQASNTSSHLKNISEDEIIDYNSFVNKYSDSGIRTNADKFVLNGISAEKSYDLVKDEDFIIPKSDHKDLDDFVLPKSDRNIESFLNPQSPEFKPIFSRTYSEQLDMIDFNIENASSDKNLNINASEWLPNEAKISNDKQSDIENSTKKRKGKKKYQNITTEIDFQHIRNLETNEYNKIPIRETFNIPPPPPNAEKTKKQNSSFDKRLNPSAQSFVYNCFAKQNVNNEIPISSKTEFPPLS